MCKIPFTKPIRVVYLVPKLLSAVDYFPHPHFCSESAPVERKHDAGEVLIERGIDSVTRQLTLRGT
jgi:hypothetical protein